MALSERLEGSTIASALAARVVADPDRTYLRSADGDVTFDEVDAQAEALAAALAHLGIEPGERIALVLPACAEFVVSFFAAAKLGAVVVPLNPELATPELQYMLRHSETACAVTIEQDGDTDFLQLFEDLMPQLPELRYVVTVGDEDLWHDDRIFQYEDLISAGKGRNFEAPVAEPDRRFALVYTSGTSGKPKGVELSHTNLLWAAGGTAEALALRPDDRIVGISALFHVHGLGPGLLGALLTGASIVLHPGGGARATLVAIERFAATVHFGIPTLFVSELAALRERSWDLASLRLAVLAGAPVNVDLIDEVTVRMGVPAVTGYSLTETASIVSTARPSDSRETRRFTVGAPIPGMIVDIVDPGEPAHDRLPVESVGEIRVKGPGVMLGYYRQPKQTAASIDEEGFFRTGDLGLVDEQGALHLVGRTKDVIIRSGFNVYPREVEARIESHPAVQEVAAVGVADELLGEAICACVVPVEGAIVTDREIVDWCRETLADGKVPDLVLFVDELPRTDTGHVRRVDLSRAAEAEGRSA